MDALILSCGTGGGHNCAAKAAAEALKKRGHNVKLLNPYTLCSKKLARGINKTYITIAQNTPELFGTVYKIGDLYRELPFYSPVYHANSLMNGVLGEYLAAHEYDIILTSHLFCAEILTNMRRHGVKTPPVIFISTDYDCVPFTEETECDAYIVPSVSLAKEFVRRGIPRCRLYAFGIPVSGSFSYEETKEEAMRRLGMNENEKHILAAGGSMGGGNINGTLRALKKIVNHEENTHLTVICGSNRKLYEAIENENDKNITAVGYTKDMARYMKACDIFVTKPGGLSSTEAAVAGAPIIHTGAIPGCETVNAVYFSSRGMSINCGTDKELIKAALTLLRNENICRKMRANQNKYINKNAAADICLLAEKICAARKS